MSKIISVHSFRGGTGKSNTCANLAALMAGMGKRVGVIDTDIISPGIHVLFQLQQSEIKYTLNDYLWGNCAIKDTAYDILARLDPQLANRAYLIPSSIRAGDIARILREGYDVGLLNDGYKKIIRQLNLDVLIIDTHPGLNEETLLSIVISEVLLLVLRPDQQDFQGTGVTVDVARKLGVPQLLLLLNKVPDSYNSDEVKASVERIYQSEVAALLPHSDEMMTLASAGIFVMKYPQHPITLQLKALAERLVS